MNRGDMVLVRFPRFVGHHLLDTLSVELSLALAFCHRPVPTIRERALDGPPSPLESIGPIASN